MAGWHHWLDGHESEWTLGVGDGQGGLACCNSWGRKESDTTEQLVWSDLIWYELNVQGALTMIMKINGLLAHCMVFFWGKKWCYEILFWVSKNVIHLSSIDVFNDVVLLAWDFSSSIIPFPCRNWSHFLNSLLKQTLPWSIISTRTDICKVRTLLILCSNLFFLNINLFILIGG